MWSQIHTVTAEKGLNTQNMMETEESAGHGGFFWGTEISFTVQNKGRMINHQKKKKKNSHKSSR